MVCKNIYSTGLSHIFHASFITPKQRFWCSGVERDGQPVLPPWTVEYHNSTIDIWPGENSVLCPDLA